MKNLVNQISLSANPVETRLVNRCSVSLIFIRLSRMSDFGQHTSTQPPKRHTILRHDYTRFTSRFTVQPRPSVI